MPYQTNAAFFRSRPFEFFLFGWLIFPLIYWYIQSISSKLMIDQGELLYESGILSKDRTEIQISRIRTVKIHQSFTNRIFGVGTISIFTSGDSPEVVLKNFPQPNYIRELLKVP